MIEEAGRLGTGVGRKGLKNRVAGVVVRRPAQTSQGFLGGLLKR